MILRRLECSRFSEVAPSWGGLTAVVIATGPSLTQAHVDAVHRARGGSAVRVIAVNDAYLWAPWADVHYAADAHWHRWQKDGIAKPRIGMTAHDVREHWAGFGGQKCTIQSSGGSVEDERVHVLRNRDYPNNGMGLSLDPQMLVTGRNSGFQALNLAVLAGTKKIILLGFDGKPADDGNTHFFGEHPRPTPVAAFPLYRQAMSAAENALIEVGIEVLNATPGSAIDAFPKVRLEDVL